MKRSLVLLPAIVFCIAGISFNAYSQTPGVYIGKNTAPSQTLQVAGTARLDSLATTGNDILAPTSTNDLPLYVKGNGDLHAAPLGSNGQVWGISSGKLGWITASGGGITSLTFSSPLTGGTITTSGTVGISQSNTSTDGYLSSADWNTFNSKEHALTFANGLTRSTNAIALGGTLTANTDIPLATFNMTFSGTSGAFGVGTSAPLFKLDARGTNAKATTTSFENIFQVGSTDASGPLALRFGVKTDATSANRYGGIEVDDNGTKQALALQASGGNVGIGTTAPASTLTVAGSVAANYTTTSSTSYSVAATDYCVVFTGSSASTLTLPAAVSGVGNFKGRLHVIKNSGTANVTLVPSGIESIDGATSSTGGIVIAPNNSIQLISTGATSGVTWDCFYQTAATVLGNSAAFGLISSTTTYTAIPGLTQTIVIPSNTTVIVTTDGESAIACSGTTTWAQASIGIFVDGSLNTTIGGVRSVAPANTAALAGGFFPWSFSIPLSLAAGSHTLTVRAKWIQGSAACGSSTSVPSVYINAGTGTVAVPSMTVTVIKQ